MSIQIQIDAKSINGTTEVTEVNRCPYVETLFERKEGNIRILKKIVIHFDFFV
jgi:hypothetical protein